MKDIPIPTAIINQDTFPGAWIEPLWPRPELVKEAPYYALRILCGAKIIENPAGRAEYISMTFEGTEYVLHKQNYQRVLDLIGETVFGLLEREGYDPLNKNFSQRIRNSPDLILQAHRFASNAAKKLWDVPVDKTRMIWLQPDLSACGHYRSYLPFSYNHNTRTDFHSEHMENVSQSNMSWFDVFIAHRFISTQMLPVFQQLKAAGKILIYEYDDDIFNVPEWNFNSERITPEVIDRSRQCIEMADLIIASTLPLLDVCARPEIAMLGPNLINMEHIGEPLKCDRELKKQWVGYVPEFNTSGALEFKHKQMPTRTDLDKDFDQVRILWTGSNTHDKDLEQIEPAVLSIGKKFGMAVKFIFFGFCPPEFIEVITEAGNTKPKYQVKPKYSHFVQFVPPVRFNLYYKMIRSIDPDFAICPLADHAFNLSKSNLKILELSAFGIPCIATDYGPYQCLCKDSINGIKVKGNAESWVEAIESLIKLNHVRKELGANARRWVEEEYSWQSNGVNRGYWDKIFACIHNLSSQNKAARTQQVNEMLCR